MKTTLILGIAALIAGSALAPGTAQAQQAGTRRTDLQRHDLSAPGREVVQVRVDFDPGYVAPRHTHPGEEIVFVLEGTLRYEIEGPRMSVRATVRSSPHTSSRKGSRSSRWSSSGSAA